MRRSSVERVGRRTRVAPLAMLVVLVVVVGACGRGEEVTGDSLDGSSWEMTSVWDESELVPANPTSIVTAVFADGEAAGYDGCNLYQFPYSIGGDSVSFGELSITGRACDRTYFEPQGDVFIAAMQASERFILSKETLELADVTGVVRLRFRPAQELPLAGVSWWLEGYAGSEGGMVSPLAGTQISLAFGNDGTLVGIAGCNDYFADYQSDGNELAIGAVAHTERACLDPDGVMTQENDYLSVLRQARAFNTSLTGLELLDDEGNPVAEYRFGGRTR